ncbi:MAG: TatD family hydrolase [Planctomycetota bacterium]
MRLIDIGANLASNQFKGDRDEVLSRAREAGVERLVITGSDVDGSGEAADLADTDPAAWSTAGVHPHHAKDLDGAGLERIASLLGRPRVVAVGECGLDYNRNYSPREDQLRAFEAQLDLAARSGLPLFLHQRDAHDDFLAMLQTFWARLPGGAVVHCFTGGPAQAEEYLELGCHLGITGWVCDERRGDALREAVPRIPADRLMVETDAPYLLPRTIRPRPATRRCEPMHLPWVVREVAALRGEDPEEVAASSWSVAERFFRL